MPVINSAVSTAVSYPAPVINPPRIPTPAEIKGNTLKPARVYNANGVIDKTVSAIETGHLDSGSDVDGNLSGKALFALALQHAENNPIHKTVQLDPTVKPKGHLFTFLMWLSGAHTPLSVRDKDMPSAKALSPYLDRLASQRQHEQNTLLAHTRIKRSSSENNAAPQYRLHDRGMTSFVLNDENLSTQELIIQTAILCLDRERCDQLAKTLLQWQGLYAGQPDQRLSVPELKETIRQFVEDNTYQNGFADYALHHVRQDSNITNVDQLSVALSADKLASLQDAQEDISDFVQENIIEQKLPILRNWRQTADSPHPLRVLELKGLDWVLINAGLHYYNQLTQHLEDPAPPLSNKEAHMLGETVYEQLKMGAVSAELASCFAFACQVRYVATHRQTLQNDASINEDTLTQQSLSAFFTDHEAHILAINPFMNYEHHINQYKTRPELAKEVIDNECAKRGISVTDYLNSPDSTFCPTLEQMSLDNDKPAAFIWLFEKLGLIQREGKILADINEKFTRQNQALAEAYGKLDKILVANVFDTLPKSELEFLHNAAIQPLTATFRPSAPLMFQPNSANLMGQEHFKVEIKNCDLFSAHQGNEERIYVMTFNGEAYSLKRIDRAKEQYVALTTELHPHFTYRLALSPLSSPVHQPGMPLSALIDPVVKKHQADYEQLVHKRGYESTTKEKTAEFLRSLIPFVLCKDAITEGRVNDAVFNCGLDAALFIAPLMKLGHATTRVGQVFTAGMLKSMSHAAQATAARQALRTVVSQAGKDIARYAMHPAFEGVIKPQAAGIATSILRAADPGFEFGFRLSKGTLTTSVQLLNKMKGRFPRINQLRPRIENALNHIPETVTMNGVQLKGRFAGVPKEVDVTAISAPLADGSRMCILSLPNQQATSRYQYRLSNSGELTPLPVNTSLRRRLHLILTEGLSGRGVGIPIHAPIKEVDASMLQQIKNHLGKRPAKNSLDELAEQFQVKKEKLAIYVSEGQLTPAGHDLLEQGPSLLTSTSQQATKTVSQSNTPVSGENVPTLRQQNAAKKIQSSWREWRNNLEDRRAKPVAGQTHIQTSNEPKLVNSLKGSAQAARNKGMVNHSPLDGKGPTLSIYQQPGDILGLGGNAVVRHAPRGFLERVDRHGGTFDPPAVAPSSYSELKSFVSGVDPVGDGERRILRNAGQDLLKFIYVRHGTLTLQDFQRPLQDLAKLHEKGLYHLDIKLSNMAVKDNNAGARTLSFIDCDGITDKLEEPLAMTFRRHVLSPDLDHMITVTGRADDEHAMALSMMQATDLAFSSTIRQLAELAADNDLLAEAALRQSLHMFATRFVDKYVLEPYRPAVLKFITLPTQENTLTVPLAQTVDFNAPTGLVAAMQSGNAAAITKLGTEAMNKATGPEQRVAALVAENAQGISGYTQLMTFGDEHAKSAWIQLYNRLLPEEKSKLTELHYALEAQRDLNKIAIDNFEHRDLDSL